jgi:hypothetical protein
MPLLWRKAMPLAIAMATLVRGVGISRPEKKSERLTALTYSVMIESG